MDILIVGGLFIALALATHFWGYDSRDDICSLEWMRRQQWYGFH
jgi:hypothetical protein